MIVRQLQEAEQTDRKIYDPNGNWDSTTIYEGADFRMHYQNHLESVYCISGEGEIESLEDGKKYSITPGTLYNLDQHDRHMLRAFKELKLACVFNPPLHGTEVHNKDGSYELEADTISS